MSLDMSLSRVSRCLPNSSSGQWRSRMNVCRASNFQKRSSDVPEPLLQSNHRSVSGTMEWPSINHSPSCMDGVSSCSLLTLLNLQQEDWQRRQVSADHGPQEWSPVFTMDRVKFLLVPPGQVADRCSSAPSLMFTHLLITLLYDVMAQEVQAHNKSWALSFFLSLF